MDNLETAEDSIRRARASLASAATAASAGPAAWVEPLRLALDAIESAVAELSELRDPPLESSGETGPDASYIR
ncbi:hypothetical protein ABCS02_31150 [Microbacterium sp. X-17]|uniref:hypothetical protein n=1 Tax=Microbacterium sp. X-17 TaxID=3144404 RepID=UPI0031F56559